MCLYQTLSLYQEIKVLYEDENMVVVEKPYDIRMNVKKGEDRNYPEEYTLTDFLQER